MGALHLVPCPPKPLVCVAVSVGGTVHARLLLRDTPWRLIPRSLGEDQEYLAPYGSGVTPTGGSVPKLRHGDMIIARPPASARVPGPMPIFLTAEQARHQAVWQLPFLLTQRDQVTLWRPDRPQQVVSLPAGASWRPTAASFVTDWSGQHARWAPMPWIPDTGLHLCLRSDEANRANVVLWNRSPVCRQLARSPPPTHVVRGTANMDPSDVLLRDGDVLTPRVPASRSTLLRPLWPLLLTLWGCRGCCLDGEAPRTLLLFLWVAYGLSSAPANALVFSPESRAEPASERWSKPYSGSHIDLGSVTPPRPTSVAQAIAGSSLRLCYLRPHGAPVWRRHSSSCWEADITPAGQLQEKLYEFWLADDLPTSLPSRVPWKLQQAWYAYPTWTCGVPEQVLISTDGTGLHTGAWAFVAWGWHAGQWYRLGWEHGVVCQQWSIAPGLLSYAAELAALQTAALWACVWLDANAAAWHTKPTVITAAVDNSVLRPVMPRLWPGGPRMPVEHGKPCKHALLLGLHMSQVMQALLSMSLSTLWPA